VSSTSRGRLLVSSVLLLTGVGVWLGFIAVRNELLNTGGLLPQIALPFLTVGLLMAAAWFYRAARQSQAGFWIAAILLVGMAAYTFWPWYWTASTILTLGAVSVLVAGLASKGMRREQPRGDESTDQAGDPVTQEPSDGHLVAWLWLGVVFAVGASFIVMMTIGSAFAGVGALRVPRSVQDHFNLLSVTVLPPAILLVTCWALLIAFVRLRVTSVRWRVLLLAAIVVVALVPTIILFGGNMATDPLILLVYDVPVIATALYAGFAKRPTALSALSVAAFSGTVGLLLFVLTWALVGGPTD